MKVVFRLHCASGLVIKPAAAHHHYKRICGRVAIFNGAVLQSAGRVLKIEGFSIAGRVLNCRHPCSWPANPRIGARPAGAWTGKVFSRIFDYVLRGRDGQCLRLIHRMCSKSGLPF